LNHRKLRTKLIVIALALPVLAGMLRAWQGQTTQNAPAAARIIHSAKPFAVTLRDVAPKAGLNMKFTSGNENTKRYIIEANGSGVAFLDYDRDGRQDLFLVNGSRLEGFASGQETPTNHLYRNVGNGRFEDVTEKTGLTRSGWGNGVCVADVDNDGFDDLFVTYWGHNVLYRNTGKGNFADITEAAGLLGQDKVWSSGCTFLDYDRDGHLDLLVTSYQQFDPATAPLPGKGQNCEWKGMPVFCGPRGLPFGKVTLYHNRGDNTFEDATAKAGMQSAGSFYAFTAVALDLNDDGWTDLYVACDSTPSLFFRNNKNGTFTELGAESGLAFNEHGFEQGGMGIAVGDYDNDGRIDLLKTNFAGDYPNLFHNTGGGSFEDLVLKGGLAVNPQYVGWGVGFVDLDNDGWKDIVQVNGHVYPELDRAHIEEKYRNPRLVYRNLGNGTFEDVSAATGPDVAAKHSSRGAAFGDFDNDGHMDVLVMNMGEPPSLLRSEATNDNHWIKVLLEGKRSNRSAIGAQVVVEAGGVKQTDAVLSQSSYVSRSDPRLHFGLGKAQRVDRFVVRWPNGETEEFAGSPADQLVVLTEGTKKTESVALRR
jgi:enediyne biosynthesis protein E4